MFIQPEETLQDNESDTGFIFTTPRCARAFQMAEAQALNGYSIKLHGICGGVWTVEVTESERAKEIAMTLLSSGGGHAA